MDNLPLIQNMKSAFTLSCLMLLVCLAPQMAFAQCANDTLPPVGVCFALLQRDVPPSGSITVPALAFSQYSEDNCTPAANLQHFVEVGAASTSPPTTTALTFTAAQAGLHSITHWIVDSAGNASYCTSSLQITPCQATSALVCNDLVTVSLDANNSAVITPDMILEGGPYCNYINYLLQLDPTPITPPTPTLTVGLPQVGLHTIKVIDPTTANACWGQVNITAGVNPCAGDTIAPVATCLAQIVRMVSATGITVVTAQQINFGSTDNCTTAANLDLFVQFGPPTATFPQQTQVVLNTNQLGEYPVVLWVVDESNNASYCQMTVTLTNCQNAALVCNDQVTIDLSPSGSALFSPQTLLEGGPYCPYHTFTVALDGVSYGPSLLLTSQHLGAHLGQVSTTGLNGLPMTCWGTITVIASTPIAYHLIKGTVFLDNNLNCQRQDSTEAGLANWVVRATAANGGPVFVANTDAQGHYSMLVDHNPSSYTVVLDVPYNYGGDSCLTSHIATFPSPLLNDTVSLDIPVQLDNECPRMIVDLAAPKIRPCFQGVYFVRYTNASTQTIANTYIDVTLDAYLTYLTGSLPATNTGNQVYRFQTGALTPGQSEQLTLTFQTDCNAPLGATHCTEAHLYPDTLCPNSQFWSGAAVTVAGACVNDSIFLKIKNTGSNPTQTLEYIVVEDVLMRQMGTFSLPAGGELNLDPIPGNGATFRLQAEQEPWHPYGGMPAVWIEGCAGFTPGMVTLFPTNNADPFVAVHCIENTASFDPNDKTALPKGYATAHWIDPNIPLDYTIRFQNTGTDTAFRVVIVDTLPEGLNGRALRPGASSHPYRYELLDGRIARFTFDPIALPDSNANVEASQGFVQFKAPQRPGNPDGTLLENTAAIYFDFNQPVLTNTTHHTIGRHFIQVTAVHTAQGRPTLQVYPNPSSDFVRFEAAYPTNEPLHFTLTDALGQTVRQIRAAQLPMTLESAGLPAGAYFFRFGTGKAVVWSGTVLVQ